MLISFREVSKIYNPDTRAVDEVTFTIDKGEFLFLVGPSGAGKTTLLRLLIRDLLPTKGQIIVGDEDVTKLKKSQIPVLRRKIGMIFQDFKILYEKTVYENIAIALDILGKQKAEIDKKVGEVLELVGLSSRKHHFPVQLSAGELQRASIARAIIGGPKVLLADEPTGNLDPATSWEILNILGEINKQGTTVVMATHDMDVVNSLKKRVISMKEGKVVKDKKRGKYE